MVCIEDFNVVAPTGISIASEAPVNITGDSINLQSPKITYNESTIIASPLALTVDTTSIFLTGADEISIVTDNTLQIVGARVIMEGAITLSGEVAVVGLLTGDDLDVGVVVCGDIESGDVVCGIIESGDVFCGNVSCGDVVAIAIECVTIVSTTVEAGILLGLPL